MINPYTNEKITNEKSMKNLIVSYIKHYRNHNKMNGGSTTSKPKNKIIFVLFVCKKIVKNKMVDLFVNHYIVIIYSTKSVYKNW